ncbi:peptidoglycan linked surface protein, putative [Listeria monocytogenes]|uniref:LapB repeat-containing protein n=1 Tax=Listeria monocytogenes TaxID=1639 RepID=UPI000A1D4B62|nr:LapB repeat-containing protein [Listeria monocytogenes]ARM71658.1 peptidoglycan linked surface protein, putative [Listeria monocytogenes]
MIKKIFTGVLAGAILIQTSVGPTHYLVNATVNEQQPQQLQLETKEKNNMIGSNDIIIKGAVENKEYTLTLPKEISLDTTKLAKNITYDKDKNEVTMVGTGEAIDLTLITSKVGTYPLELKEQADVQAKLALVITEKEKAKDEAVTKPAGQTTNKLLGANPLLGATISDKLLLQAEGSKTTLTNYTDQMTINYSVNFLDGSTTLKNGKLVIDFQDSGFELVNYPKNTAANANIKSTDYSALTGKLTINFVDNIQSGAPFDIPVVVRAAFDAEPGKASTLKATLSGSNSAGDIYSPVEKNVTATLVDGGGNLPYVPITAGDKSWQFTSPQTMAFSNKPGGYDIRWTKLTKQSSANKSFKNLKIEYLKENGGDVFDVQMTGLNMYKDGDSVGTTITVANGPGNVLTDTPEKKVMEFGSVNANLYKALQIGVSSRLPADAIAGTVYTGTVNFYDGDVLVDSLPLSNTVAEAKTTITVNTTASKTSMAEQDIIDWGFTPRVSSALGGVNDLQIVAPIPEGLTMKAFTPNNNSLNGIKKIEYYQDGAWKAMDANVPSANSWDFTKVDQTNHRLEKLRITYKNGLIDDNSLPPYSPGTIRMQNTGVKAGDSFTLQPEAITYTDFDQTSQSIDTDTSAFKKTVQVTGDPAIQAAKINGSVTNSSISGIYGKDFGSTIFFNGDKLAQSVRLGSYGSKLENPYIFVVVPKGVEVVELRNYIQQPYSGKLDYIYAPSNGSNTIYPKAQADVSGKETLSDGSTLYYWEAPDTSLAPSIQICEMLGLDLGFNLNKAESGDNRVEFGMGSMTDANWNINGGKGNNDLQTKTLSPEIQDKLPGVTSAQYLSTTKVANVGVSNSLATKMKIKGSQDKDYVDVSSKTATTIPGKKVAYNLTFTNNGTKSMNDLEIIDILPHVGDQYVLGTGARGSEFAVVPTSEIEVLVNGEKSDKATIEYSTSATPERFDTDGEDVAGDAWQMSVPTNMSDVKSFRIKLPNTEFKVGDEITLNFDGVVPTDAPRNGEIAYNSVAYRVTKETASGTTKLASEPPRGGVKSTTPSTDLGLSGNAFTDLNRNGVQDANEKGLNSVQLDLYEKIDGSFKKIESAFTSPDSTDQKNGLFDFVGLGNGTYKIAAHLPNDHAEFITTGENKVVLDSKDETIGWLTKNGSTEFTIDDLAGSNPKTISGIQLPIFMTTPVQGSVIFMNKAGERKITSYGEGYQVTLLDADGKEVQSAVTANNKGEFSFDGVTIQNATNFKLKVTSPEGTNFVYAPQNTLFNTTTKEYALNNVLPGVGGTAEIYITDTGAPTTKINLDRSVTPKAITIESSDAATKVTNKWTLEDSAGTVLYTGTGNHIRIPGDEGTYTAKNTATDEAGNTASTEKTFDVDNTAPTLTVNQDASMEVNSTEANITWVKALVATSTDTHDGTVTPVMDYSEVNWNELGTYPVKVTATDVGGNQVTQTVQVRVVDTIAPTIIVTNNPVTYSVEAIRTLTEQDLFKAAGLIGGDNYDLAPGSTPQPNKMPMVFTSDFSTVFSNQAQLKVGQYQVKVNLVDSSGNQATTQTITINVQDNVAPVITADASVSYHIHSDVTEAAFLADAHFQATDNNDASTDLVTTTDFATKVDFTKPGNYDVTIRVTDKAGNVATKKVVVQVSKDKPVITADPNISYQGKTAVTEAAFLTDVHATVTDELGGNITITSDFAQKVDLNKVGTYIVTLNAEDAYGNKANPMQVHVKVENHIAPTFENVTNQEIEATKDLPALSSIFKGKAVDYVSGKELAITYTPEQPIVGNVPGDYRVKVTTTDASGNTSETSVTLSIVDTTGPSITAEKATKNIEIASTETDWMKFFGIQATDIVDGDVTADVKVDASEVNLAKLGSYTLTFTVIDAAGNESSKFQTTLQVVDTTLPVLTIGKKIIHYPKGIVVTEDQFLQDIEASATDKNGTAKITTNLANVVNWKQAGDYEVTVTATDEAGNTVEKTVVVTIKANDPAIVTPTTPASPGKPGTTKPVVKGGSFIPNNPTDPTTNTPKQTKKMPKTGDTATWNTELIFSGIFLLLTGIVLFRKKKTKTK